MFYDNWTWEQTLVYAILFGVVNALPMWLTIRSNKHTAPDSTRDAKYAPWVRKDFNAWQSYMKAFFTHYFYFPRLIIGIGCILAGIVAVYIIDFGTDKSKPQSGWRRSLFFALVKRLSRLNALVSGCVWTTSKRV